MPDSTPAAEPVSPPPVALLPAALTRPASILWLWLLPACVLLLLNLHGYGIISGNMEPEQRALAHHFGAIGLLNAALALVVYGVARRSSRLGADHPAWAVPMVLMQVAHLWLAGSWSSQILPASVTAWIYTPERFLHNQLTFTMMPLALGVLRLACMRPPRQVGVGIAISLAGGVGAPLLLYVAVLAVTQLRALAGFLEVGFGIIVVGLGLVMFLGIVRALMLLLHVARRTGTTGERVAIVLVALVMPCAGLLLNREIPFPVDLQGWEVYALTTVNAALLLLASWRGESSPRSSLVLLSATFPFTLYFFVVFLPYTPLSIFAILAIGLGFLVLTPTFLFTLHLHLLNRAWSAATRAHPGARIQVLVGACVCALVLPAFFAVRALADRAALHAALDHVTEPVISGTDADLTYSGSRYNLHRAIRNHRRFKHGIYYPILSDAYASIVFDSLSLPDETLDRLERTFFGQVSTEKMQAGFGFTDIFGTTGRARMRMPRAAELPRTVSVRSVEVQSIAHAGDTHTATVRITLEHTQTAGPAAEYVQTLPIAPGVVVSGFRLHINGVAVPGRLFERKTALWVYQMIRDADRRDPGLLRYTGPDTLELRVFPITPGAPVVVELDLLYHGAAFESVADLQAPGPDDPATVLARVNACATPALVAAAGGQALVTGLERADLARHHRPGYVHVIVDRSAANGFEGDLAAALRQAAALCPDARDVRVTLANYDVRDLDASAIQRAPTRPINADALDKELPCRGGLVLDTALAYALRQHLDRDLDAAQGARAIPARPVIVILSRTLLPELPDLPIARAWFDLAPDMEIHGLDTTGAHQRLRQGPAPEVAVVRCGGAARCVVPLITFPPAADPATTAVEAWSPERASWRSIELPVLKAPGSPWSAAIQLQARQQAHERSPGDPDHTLRSLVTASRESGILLASTSYIVVENAAQWRMLELSESQKLGQAEALEFLETPAPPALVVAALLALWLLLRRGWRRAVRSAPQASHFA